MFDAELGAKRPEVQPSIRIPKPKPKRKAPAAAAEGGAVARAPSGPEVLRLAHNKGMEAARHSAEAACAHYLLRHVHALAPFLAPAALQRLRSAAAAAPAPPPQPPLGAAPAALTAELREYQLAGVQWLAQMRHAGCSCILADEMGLGKTLQTISLLAYLQQKPAGLPAGPHLVVCPLSVLPSWMAELKRWCPSLRVVRLHTSDKQECDRLCHEVLAMPASFDVAVTTYEARAAPNACTAQAQESQPVSA